MYNTEQGVINVPEGAVQTRPRLVDRLDPNLVNVLTALGFGLPIAGYFWIVARYSVNVILDDQWGDVTVIKASHSHVIPWGVLWAQWNENRMFFPRLIVIVLARAVHFNIQVEEYLSAIMLLGATALLIWCHKRRSRQTPWLYYCPVAFLSFSLVQYGNTLWGFQMAWYLVLLSLAVALVFLDRTTLTWLVLFGAIGAGVVGSFSSLQGLLIWPAGLVLLYHRRRGVLFIASWVAAGVATVLFYFQNFNVHSGAPFPNYAWQHPIAAIKFYLFLVGDIVGESVKFGQGNNYVILFGFVIVILAAAPLVIYGIYRDEIGGSPIGMALICFGLLFAVTVTQGRIIFGYSIGASASRYTTYDLMILVGIYLALLGRPPLLAGPRLTAARKIGRTAWERYSGRRRIESGSVRSIVERVLPATRLLVIAIVVVQIVFAISNGLTGIRSTHQTQEHDAHVLRDFHHSPGAAELLDLFAPERVFQEQASTAQRLHLSLFARPPAR